MFLILVVKISISFRTSTIIPELPKNSDFRPLLQTLSL